MSQPQNHPFDPGNQFVSQMELPAALSIISVQSANGPRLLVTIRCGTATLTILLNRDDATAWGDALKDNARGLSPLLVARGGLPVDPGSVLAFPGGGQDQ